MNRHPLTTVTVEEAEDAARATAVLVDLTARIFADNVVEPHEMIELQSAAVAAHQEATETVHAADHADSAFRIGMSWMHNGPEARRSKDLTRSYEETFNDGAPIDLDRYRKTTKRRRESTPIGAA